MEVNTFVNTRFRQVEMHAAESCNTAHHRINNRLYKSTGERCVYCITPRAKNICTSFYGVRLQAYNH